MVQIVSNNRKAGKHFESEVERLVSLLQDSVNEQSMQWMSKITKETDRNEAWLDEITGLINVKSADEIEELKSLRQSLIDRMDKLEDKVTYYEELCDELEQFTEGIVTSRNK